MSEEIYFQGNQKLGNYKSQLSTCAIAACTVVGLLWAIPKLISLMLRVSTTSYLITSEKIQIESGVLSKRRHNIDLWRVKDIMFKQTLWQRLFGESGFVATTQDTSHPYIEINGLPLSLGRLLFESLQNDINKARKENKVVSLAS